MPLSVFPVLRRLLMLASVALGGSAWAQAAGEPPVAPPVTDTIAQRVQACTGCHGPQGRATNLGYFPRIAGKPVGYLYNQLVNFKEGRRQYPLMTYLVDHLSDAYLLEISRYFSELNPPYPPPAPVPSGAGDALSRGETLVRRGDAQRNIPACVQCHGAALTGVEPSVPGLVGLPRDYLNGQLGAWRTGLRHAVAPDCMATIAQRMAPQDIAAVSTWLASQAVPPNHRPAAPSAADLPLPCGSALER